MDLHDANCKLAQGVQKGNEEAQMLRHQAEDQLRAVDQKSRSVDMRCKQLDDKEKTLNDLDTRLNKKREQLDVLEQQLAKVSLNCMWLWTEIVSYFQIIILILD